MHKTGSLVGNEPLHSSKFILDVQHLGKLAKFLRLLGFDTVYNNSLNDREFIEQAQKENRIVLTRDLGILKTIKLRMATGFGHKIQKKVKRSNSAFRP